jgi:hypothetical protein
MLVGHGMTPIGDTEVVTVDVWAMRVAFGRGWGPEVRTGDDDLELVRDRVGVYEAIEHAYLRAGKRLGMLPTAVQATARAVVTRV